MTDEKQAYSELEADYQAMKSREDRIKAILAEKDFGPLIEGEGPVTKRWPNPYDTEEKPVKKWWEEITPDNPKLVRWFLSPDEIRIVEAKTILKLDDSIYSINRFGRTEALALVTGHEYRAYTLDPKDWPNLDDTEGLE